MSVKNMELISLNNTNSNPFLRAFLYICNGRLENPTKPSDWDFLFPSARSASLVILETHLLYPSKFFQVHIKYFGPMCYQVVHHHHWYQCCQHYWSVFLLNNLFIVQSEIPQQSICFSEVQVCNYAFNSFFNVPIILFICFINYDSFIVLTLMIFNTFWYLYVCYLLGTFDFLSLHVEDLTCHFLQGWRLPGYFSCPAVVLWERRVGSFRQAGRRMHRLMFLSCLQRESYFSAIYWFNTWGKVLGISDPSEHFIKQICCHLFYWCFPSSHFCNMSCQCMHIRPVQWNIWIPIISLLGHYLVW